MVTLSWVEFASGWRNDLNACAELAHQRGALLFVDGIQGLGVFPLDVQSTPIDFLAADGHKWLLGPEGAGLLYIRRPHLEMLQPLGVGWNSVQRPYDFSQLHFQLKPTAGRYEGGTYNMGGFVGLNASLELLMRYGPDRLSQRILELGDVACRLLTNAGAEIYSCREPAQASGIVSFTMPGRDPAVLRTQCRQQGVVLSQRGAGLRISPHGYNNEEDVDRLIFALTQPLYS